jgi:hypothetical protein
MHRLPRLTLALAAATIALTACSGGSDEPADPPTTVTTSAAPEETPTEGIIVDDATETATESPEPDEQESVLNDGLPPDDLPMAGGELVTSSNEGGRWTVTLEVEDPAASLDEAQWLFTEEGWTVDESQSGDAENVYVKGDQTARLTVDGTLFTYVFE